MGFNNLVDLHVHTDNSCDGHDSLMVICEHAVARGLRALAVTDHAECHRYFQDGFHLAVRYSNFETKKAQAAFRGQIAVVCGLELGQPLHDLEAARDAVNANPLDFIVAGLHCIKGHKDFWALDYAAQDVDRLLTSYFNEVYEMVCWGQFDALAHLTYPLRYIVGREKIPVDLADYDAIITGILEELVRRNKALELNTQGYRTEYGRPTPDFAIFQKFRAMGGQYVTVGSDAHYARDVGANVADGLAVLKAAGFDHVTLFDRREPILIPIE